MEREDFKERLIQEYLETRERFCSLFDFIGRWERNSLTFEPQANKDTMKLQAYLMGQWLEGLEARSHEAGIEEEEIVKRL